MKEVWKDVQGYEGLYQVSNLGRIKSLKRLVRSNKFGAERLLKERILHSTDNGNGYKIIGLRISGKRNNFYIHRLVATAFIENPHNFGYVNHIDHNTYNNTSNNLEWCTQKHNINHSRYRMMKPKKATYSNTGIKYIYSRNGKYRVCVPNNPERTFKTLEAAKEYRGVIMNERKES